MAILQVSEFSGASSRQDEKGDAEYVRKFRVVTSSAFVGAAAVKFAVGVPRVGDIYATSNELDTTALAKEVRAQQDSDNPRLWEVSVTYGSPTVSEPGQSNPNPLMRPAILRWSSAKVMRPCTKDINGQPICNSALEMYDPPPEADHSNQLLTITRNQISYNPSIAEQYENAVNSDSFLGFEPGRAKIDGISAQSQTENNIFFWSVQFDIAFRRDGWLLSILDCGRNERYGPGLVPILQRNEAGVKMRGCPVTSPVPLNKAGRELADPSPGNSKFNDFTIRRSLPFAVLGIP